MATLRAVGSPLATMRAFSVVLLCGTAVYELVCEISSGLMLPYPRDTARLAKKILSSPRPKIAHNNERLEGMLNSVGDSKLIS